jgi:hypothetical protein
MLITKFKVEIEMGNDAMQNGDDIASALEAVAKKIRDDGRWNGFVWDINGNTVGDYSLSNVNS